MVKTVQSTVSRLMGEICNGKKVLYVEPTRSIRNEVLDEVMNQIASLNKAKTRIEKGQSACITYGSSSLDVVGEEQEVMLGRVRSFREVDCGVFISRVPVSECGITQVVKVFMEKLNEQVGEVSADVQERYREIYLKEILPVFDVYMYTDADGREHVVPLTATSHFTGRNITREGVEALLRLKEQGKRVLYLDTSIERKVEVLTQYTRLVQNNGKILYMGRYLPTRISHPRFVEINPFLDSELMDEGFQSLGADKETHLVYRASMVDKWFDKVIDTLKDHNHGVLVLSMETDNLLQDMGLKYLVAKHKGFDLGEDMNLSEQVESIVYSAVDVVLYNVNDAWLEVNIKDWV